MSFTVVHGLDDTDEYDYDPYAGIDFDAIPELNQITQQATQGHEVEQPEGTGSQHQSVVALETSSVVHEQQALGGTSPRTANERSPSTSYSDDGYDADFLAQVDIIESAALAETAQAAESNRAHSSEPCRQPTCDEKQNTDEVQILTTAPSVERISRKRSLSQSSMNNTPREQCYDCPEKPTDVSPNSPRSAKKLKKLMDDFEDEMTCPVCCDIFACAYLLNPCGHSYCGDCALGWITKNTNNAVCAVCRAPVAKRNPMVPNITLDNTVQRHVDALGENGVAGWQEAGGKLVEWKQRKEQWKIDGLCRLEAAKKGRRKKK